MSSNVHFSSERQDWATPWPFFLAQAEKYGPFNQDVCALPHNAKCESYLTPDENALARIWPGPRCWMNPPYGRAIGTWVREAYLQTCRLFGPERVVCLLPARTDTAWWHDWVIPHAANIDFIRGRIKFEGAKHSAPFPSAIVVFDKQKHH